MHVACAWLIHTRNDYMVSCVATNRSSCALTGESETHAHWGGCFWHVLCEALESPSDNKKGSRGCLTTNRLHSTRWTYCNSSMLDLNKALPETCQSTWHEDKQGISFYSKGFPPIVRDFAGTLISCPCGFTTKFFISHFTGKEKGNRKRGSNHEIP